MIYCAAVLCHNNTTSGYGMFTFPKDPGLNRSWRKNMEHVKSNEPRKLWESSRHSRLCGCHFEDSCFIVSPTIMKYISFKPEKLRLRPGAIPTIFKRKPDPGRQPTRPTPRAAFEKRRSKNKAISRIIKLCIHATLWPSGHDKCLFCLISLDYCKKNTHFVTNYPSSAQLYF
ncbi:THAP domain-containing protein 10 [Nymphon striatum]|nr:THAP domain-containing protein 10 [Nymphon striatum]